MDEDIKVIDYPYYETTYLDDNNTKHIAYIKNNQDLDFYKERFTVIDCGLRTA